MGPNDQQAPGPSRGPDPVLADLLDLARQDGRQLRILQTLADVAEETGQLLNTLIERVDQLDDRAAELRRRVDQVSGRVDQLSEIWGADL